MTEKGWQREAHFQFNSHPCAECSGWGVVVTRRVPRKCEECDGRGRVKNRKLPS